MSITPYLVGGSALVVGLAVGYVKFMERGAAATTAKAEAVTVAAQCAVDATESVNSSALDQIAFLTAEVERQKQIAALEAKKSRQRLDAYNALNREIANVKDNPPVPDALELNLDAARLRGAVAGSSGPAASGPDQSPDGAAAGSDRPVLPSPASSPAQAPGA